MLPVVKTQISGRWSMASGKGRYCVGWDGGVLSMWLVSIVLALKLDSVPQPSLAASCSLATTKHRGLIPLTMRWPPLQDDCREYDERKM
nr:hypothetical protein CFP56_70044 [Quercus suber]